MAMLRTMSKAENPSPAPMAMANDDSVNGPILKRRQAPAPLRQGELQEGPGPVQRTV
jgi:hypothetical protein